MLSATRLVTLSITAVLLPLLVVGEATAGGGFFPSLPSDFGFVLNSSPNFTATIVLDPNGPVTSGSGAPATLTGTFGTIAITRAGRGTATAAFQVQPGSSLGELRFGCNLLVTNPRFVEFAPAVSGLPLGGPSIFGNWLATDLTQELFGKLGVTLVNPSTQEVLLIPGVTGVVQQQCSAFPKGNPVVGTVPLSQIVNPQGATPSSPAYPDRTIPGVTDPTQQWYSGFLILHVTIGFWAGNGTPIP